MKEKGNKEDIVEIAQKAYKEAKSAIDGWNKEAQTDTRFYLSDQWDSKDASKLIKKGIPVLNINLIKKTIDVISGYQRQNRSDIKYYPIENGDTLVSEMISRIAMWVMKTNQSRNYISEAFKDAITTGVGWFYPEMDYSKDIINGDIRVRHESCFNMLYDPYFTELDMSDCDYIIRQKLVNKRKAKQLWPDKAKDIEEMSGAKSDYSFRQDAVVASDQGNQVLAWEYWYRCTEDKQFAVSINGDMQEITEDQVEEYSTMEDIEIISRKVPSVKVAIMIGGGVGETKPVVVYHDESPDLPNDFPFIPVWCYLTTSYSEWDKKLQGVIRPLRDPQREKNKRRSQIMHMLNSVASSGYDIEKGAYDDVNQFATGGAGKIFNRNRGFAPAQRIPAPEMPASVIQLEQMFSNDITMIGANADLMGNMSEKGAAGITIQLRQKQGMTALQEIFDNLSMSIQRLGRMLITLVVGNFSKSKVERILGEDVPYKKEIAQLTAQIAQMKGQIEQGAKDMSEMAGRQSSDMQEVDQMNAQEAQLQDQLMQMTAQYQQMQQQLQGLEKASEEFWKKWADLEVNSRYDCTVSETIENETYRISVLSALMQAQQYGMPVPPALLMEYLDIPIEDKQKMTDYVAQQQQAQMQLENQKMQLEQQKVMNQKEIELIKQGVGTGAMVNNSTPVQ